MDKKQTQKRETPIIDGDARPDMPIDTEEIKKKNAGLKPSDNKKFEAERSSDVNTLEDYKDAK